MHAVEVVTASAEREADRRLRQQRLVSAEASGTADVQHGATEEDVIEGAAPSVSPKGSGRRKWGDSSLGLVMATSTIAMAGEVLDARSGDGDVDCAKLVGECIEAGRSALSESSRALEALQVERGPVKRHTVSD